MCDVAFSRKSSVFKKQILHAGSSSRHTLLVSPVSPPSTAGPDTDSQEAETQVVARMGWPFSRARGQRQATGQVVSSMSLLSPGAARGAGCA